MIGKITVNGIIPSSNKDVYLVKEFITCVICDNVFVNEINLLKSTYPKMFNVYLPGILFNVLFDNDLNKWNNSYLSIIYNLKIKNILKV